MHRVDEIILKRNFGKVMPLIDRGESVMITRDGNDFIRFDPVSRDPAMVTAATHAR